MTISKDIQQRLKDIDPAPFRIVDGTVAFSALNGEPKATPAAYVLVEEEISGDNLRMTGNVLQRTESDFAVIIITRNVSDNTAGAAADDIEVLKEKVRRAIIGYVPSSSVSGEPLIHVSGNLLKAKSGSVWQREVFGAADYQEEQ